MLTRSVGSYYMKPSRLVRWMLWTMGAALCAITLRVASASPQGPSAFAAGYQAYQRGDLAAAISNLQAAASESGVLEDYALFFLGQAQADSHDLDGAEANFTRLAVRYPESLYVSRASLALANIALTRKQYEQARSNASMALDSARHASLQASARLVLARALIGLGRTQEAYEQLQEVRRNHPRSTADAGARALEKSLLRAHPELADVNSLAYLTQEAQLLLTEGQLDEAYFTAQEALALEAPASTRAAMLWVQAKASHARPERAERAFKSYLAVAPHGPKAPDALYDLARIYWHRKDTAGARSYFRQIVSDFPANSLVAAAMLRIARTYEDEHRLDAARSAYLQLAATRPHTEPAADARFRSVWLLYTSRQFGAAAAGFQSMRPRAADASERAMYDYWRARSLEQEGENQQARDILSDLAASTVTNYYPEIAARRVGAPRVDLPVVALDPPDGVPSAVGRALFHLQRAMALRQLALANLELGELRRVRELTDDSRSMRLFLLAEFQRAGGYHDATMLATSMVARGELSNRMAEPIRYPLAFWSDFSRAASRTGVSPVLLLALSRQESLFDPTANSSADARGVMQLLPSTALKVALKTGVPQSSVDLYDPSLNIELGSANVRMLLQMFNDDQFKAIAAYNAGEEAVQRWETRYPGADDEWVENIEYAETRNYVKKVVGGMREYRMLYPTRF